MKTVEVIRIVLSPKGFGDSRVGAILRYKGAEMLFEAEVGTKSEAYKCRKYGYNRYLQEVSHIVMSQCGDMVIKWVGRIDSATIKGELSN
ncbi:MAG: hypothetical protein ACRC3G_02430 [Bacteroidales bacterium]